MTTRGPYYEADATMAVPELYYRNSFNILFPAKGIVNYRQIIPNRLYVRLKETCSFVGQAVSNTGE